MVIALILLFQRKDFVALQPPKVLHPFPYPHASFHNQAYRLHRISNEELGISPLAYNPRPPLTYGRHRLLSIQAWMSVTPRPTVAAKWESRAGQEKYIEGGGAGLTMHFGKTAPYLHEVILPKFP